MRVDPRLRFMEPVLTYAEMWQLLEPSVLLFPAKRLIAMVASCSWEETYLRLSRIAALLANCPDRGLDQEVRARTTDLLASRLASKTWEERVIAFYVRVSVPRILAHEEVVYFLQALAILYGRDNGPPPTDEQIAFWMLAGNDHCFGWREDDEQLSTNEDLVAVTARALLFNHRHDSLPQLVRSSAMLERAPPRTPEWTAARDWKAFQTRAFGMPFDEYFDFLAGGLYIMSVGWGLPTEAGLRDPKVLPDEWVRGTGVPRTPALEFFARTSGSRAELREMLKPFVGEDGLPRGSSLFHLRPFARFANGALVPASPWAVREQLRGALWNMHRLQAKAEFGDNAGGVRWLAAFGDLFELWCRDVASMAASSKKFLSTLIVSKAIGSEDEVEDVVLVHESKVLLVSAKAATIRQDLLMGASSAAQALAWYERFLFAPRMGQQRGGAVRLLDKKVGQIRDGQHVSAGLLADSKIFPMLVTYEHLGADNPGFYMWFKDRTKAENLLQQQGVFPLVILNIEKFESLMAFAAAGGDIFEMLENRGAEERADVALFDAATAIDATRLPDLERRFDIVLDRLKARLAAANGSGAA